jgi:hypothetical protein
MGTFSKKVAIIITKTDVAHLRFGHLGLEVPGEKGRKNAAIN